MLHEVKNCHVVLLTRSASCPIRMLGHDSAWHSHQFIPVFTARATPFTALVYSDLRHFVDVAASATGGKHCLKSGGCSLVDLSGAYERS